MTWSPRASTTTRPSPTPGSRMAAICSLSIARSTSWMPWPGSTTFPPRTSASYAMSDLRHAVLHDAPVLQDQDDPGLVEEEADVARRIAVDDEHVGRLARLDRPPLVAPADRLRRQSRRGADDVERRDPEVLECLHLCDDIERREDVGAVGADRGRSADPERPDDRVPRGLPGLATL